MADDWAFDKNDVAGGELKRRMADTREHAEAVNLEADFMPPERNEDGEQDRHEDGKEGNDGGNDEVVNSAKEVVEAGDGGKTEQEEKSASAARKCRQTESRSNP